MVKIINNVLASGVIYCTTEWPQAISLRHVVGQISSLMHATQQVFSEIPERQLYDHPVTK
jgi:hypothetical protein